MKKLLLLLAAIILLVILVVVYVPFNPASGESGVSEKTTAPLVGADRDAHGCIASAGYTYSVVRQDCIRLWQEATSLAPTVVLGTPALPAYVLRSANWQHAEVFLPGEDDSVVLTLQTTPGDPSWTDPYNTWQLTYDKIQGWKLAQDGTVLYTAPADQA